jgi:hypothetical protein
MNYALLRLFTFCACCSIGACASSSISLGSLRLVQSSDFPGRLVTNLSPAITGNALAVLPNRELIRVEFTASADLRKMAKQGDKVVFLHAYFCNHGDNHVGLGGPGVYVEVADANAEQYVNGSDGRYVFFLDVTRKAQPTSIPQEQGFDLSMTSEDICVYVTAHGPLTTTYTSTVARIPKAAIDQEFGAKKSQGGAHEHLVSEDSSGSAGYRH